MRILFITPYVPNKLRTRPYHLLKQLAPRHRVTLLAPAFSADEAQDAAQLQREIPELQIEVVRCSSRKAIVNSLLALPRRQPMQARYCYSPELEEKARQLIRTQGFDLAHVEHFRGAYIGKALAEMKLPAVFDSVDCISLLVERTLKHGPLKNRAVSFVELPATRRYEHQILNSGHFFATCATSKEDAGALEELGDLPPNSLKVVPNGVDTRYFSPPENPAQRDNTTVVFSGKMSYHANAAAARFLVNKVWPLVHSAHPEACLLIVGSRPPRDLQKKSGSNGIEITGYVPDMAEFLQRATISVAPMTYSVGIQNKVLEAMACATPVIATTDVTRAIQTKDGEEMCLVERNNPAKFAAAILDLLQHPTKAAEIGRQGRSFIEQNYTWQGAALLLEELWKSPKLVPELNLARV